MSAYPISARAEELLEDAPAYEADEPLIRRLVNALAIELERAETIARDIGVGLLPPTAHDRYGGLSMLETQMGLPVAPAGLSEEARRDIVMAYLGARRAGTALAWVELMTLALGNTPWTWREGPGTYQVTIRLPYATGSFTAGQITQLARQITPAHLDVIAAYDEGFLIGISEIGVEPL